MTIHPVERLLHEAHDATMVVDARRMMIIAATRVLPEFTFPGVRARLLRLAGADVRRGVSVLGRIDIIGPRDAARRLRIGPGALIGPGVVFGLDEDITIGRNVSIGPHVMLYTATHALGPEARRMSPGVSALPIVVEEGAWIGVGALVLPGVRLGRGCVVSAGAVVTKDVPPNALVAGNPAVVVQDLATK